MKSLLSLIRVNVTYGIIALIPVALLIFAVFQLFELLKRISRPMSEYLPAHSLGSDAAVLGLAVILLLVLCFVVGTAVRTRLGALSFEKLEARVLKQIPGYEIVANVLRGFAEDKASYRPALVTLYAPGTAVLGFVMEGENEPFLTVFVPTAPTMAVGNVHVVERARVRMLDGSTMDAANCIGQWGIGLGEFRRNVAPPDVP